MGAQLLPASASLFLEACKKSSPSVDKLEAEATAPPVSEASDAITLSSTGAPRLQCHKGDKQTNWSNSILTCCLSMGLTRSVPAISFQMCCKMAIPGRRNCSPNTHLPAMICRYFRFSMGCPDNHRVPFTNGISFAKGMPKRCVSPQTSAPSSTMVDSADFLFFSEEITPASLQASSAASWQSLPCSPVERGVILSPAQKLSKYTWNQDLSSSAAIFKVSFNQEGSDFPRASWCLAERWFRNNKFSEISCIIPTLFSHPIGITVQANANSTSGASPITCPGTTRLKQRCFHQGAGTLKDRKLRTYQIETTKGTHSGQELSSAT